MGGFFALGAQIKKELIKLFVLRFWRTEKPKGFSLVYTLISNEGRTNKKRAY